jgi:hypothetical protein
MRLTRAVAALSLVTSVSLLAGCSGGDDNPDKSESSATIGSDSPSATNDAPPPADVVKKCRATVAITGKATADWEGKAEVRLSNGGGPKTVYVSRNDAGTVTAYSEGKDFPPSVNVLVDDTTYATRPGDDAGLDIGTRGRSATVDADALDVDGNRVHVIATFDC